MKTTLNAIKEKAPCVNGYRKLLTFLGKTKADDEPLAVSVILESNGLDDTVWCFRTVSGYEKEKRLFAVFCAKQVQPLMTDQRSINAINVAERYANGQATDAELKNAYIAANAAYDAAFSAARAATTNAARVAAFSAFSAAHVAYDAAAYYARAAVYSAHAADSEIKPVLEAYLKELLSEAEK